MYMLFCLRVQMLNICKLNYFTIIWLIDDNHFKKWWLPVKEETTTTINPTTKSYYKTGSTKQTSFKVELDRQPARHVYSVTGFKAPALKTHSIIIISSSPPVLFNSHHSESTFTSWPRGHTLICCQWVAHLSHRLSTLLTLVSASGRRAVVSHRDLRGVYTLSHGWCVIL